MGSIQTATSIPQIGLSNEHVGILGDALVEIVARPIAEEHVPFFVVLLEQTVGFLN
jgi:hypothetical protein